MVAKQVSQQEEVRKNVAKAREEILAKVRAELEEAKKIAIEKPALTNRKGWTQAQMKAKQRQENASKNGVFQPRDKGFRNDGGSFNMGGAKPDRF